jgi:hypothetical protein
MHCALLCGAGEVGVQMTITVAQLLSSFKNVQIAHGIAACVKTDQMIL